MRLLNGTVSPKTPPSLEGEAMDTLKSTKNYIQENITAKDPKKLQKK
jgi:hypothetical protein